MATKKKSTREGKPLVIAVRVTCDPTDSTQAEQWRQMWRKLLAEPSDEGEEPNGAKNDESRPENGAA